MSRGDFWSRRRAAVEAEEAAGARADENARAEARRAGLAGRSDEEVLVELGLPHPDAIVSGGDVRAFMAGVVSEHLRRRALRRLWRTDPALACLDGLVDCADDYADAATVRTAYRVGKDMVRQIERLEDAEPAAPSGDAPAEPAVAPVAEDGPVGEDAPEVAAPRHMAFRFDEEER